MRNSPGKGEQPQVHCPCPKTSGPCPTVGGPFPTVGGPCPTLTASAVRVSELVLIDEHKIGLERQAAFLTAPVQQ